MKTDSAFQIGKTHDICEDFALTGSFKSAGDDAYYAIVSDGCSSSPNTDLGSRLLSFSIANELKQLYTNSSERYKISKKLRNLSDDLCIARARSSIQSLNLPQDSLDATALIAYTEPGKTEIAIKGDGCVAIGLKDKRTLIVNVEFISSFPFYLNYLPEYGHRYMSWKLKNLENDGGRKVVISIINKDGSYEVLNGNCMVDTFKYEENKKEHLNSEKWISTQWNNQGAEISFINPNKNVVEFIVLMSDGINSFYRTENNDTSLINSNIDYREVISEALNFKNFNGKFVQRRLNRFTKFCQNNDWHHSDDISFGAIYFGE